MIYSMHIEADNRLAIAERILQTTRVRGFALRGLEVRVAEVGRPLRITLTVDGHRPMESLLRQLEKIQGIAEITALHSVETGEKLCRVSA